MSMIFVTPLAGMSQCIRVHAPSHLVTLLGPEFMISTPDGIAAERHLKITVNDIVEASAGELPPSETHVRALLDFSRQWNAEAPMLIHCWAGISRSMAATFTILCDRMPGEEHRIARTMRRLAPHADPNRLFVRIADDVLGRSGRLVDAIEAIGRGKLALEGRTVMFPLAMGGA